MLLAPKLKTGDKLPFFRHLLQSHAQRYDDINAESPSLNQKDFE